MNSPPNRRRPTSQGPSGFAWRSRAPQAAPSGGRETSAHRAAALATIERRGPSHRVSRRARADQAADGHANAGRLRRRGSSIAPRSQRRPRRTCRHRPRQGAAEAGPLPQERIPGAAPSRLGRRGRRGAGASGRGARAHARGGRAVTAALRRRYSSLRGTELPPLLRGPGDVAQRQLDADRRRDVARAPAHGQRAAVGLMTAQPVRADPALRGVRRRAGRPVLEAEAADGDPGW